MDKENKIIVCQQPPFNRPAACSHATHTSPKVVDTQRFRIPPLNRVAESLAFENRKIRSVWHNDE